MSNEGKKIEYPYQVFVRKTQTRRDDLVTKKTLTAEVHCDPPQTEDKGQPPLEIFGPTSRARITVLHIDEQNGKRKSTTCPWANLPQRDFAAVLLKSQQASMLGMQMNSPLYAAIANTATKKDVGELKRCLAQVYKSVHSMLSSLVCLIRTGQMPQVPQPGAQSQSQAQQTPRVNVESLRTLASANKLMGTMKAYTPLAFMVENNSEEGKKKMEGQITWLSGNLAQHPNNQKLIDSIKAAIQLYDLKQLDGEDVAAPASNSDIVIYESGPKGLNRKVKEDGFGPVKELTITWHIGDHYPVEISIVNYDAPIEERANGSINVIVSKRREPVIRESYRLTETDYFDLLDKIKMNYDRYAIMMSDKQFKTAKGASDANYQSFKDSQSGQNSQTNVNRPVQTPFGNYGQVQGQDQNSPQARPQTQNQNQQNNAFSAQTNAQGNQSPNQPANLSNGQFPNFDGGDPFGGGSLDDSLPFGGGFGGNPFGNGF